MKKRLIATITCFITTLILWGVWHMKINDVTAMVLLYGITLSAVCFACFGVTTLFAWKKSDISPYWIFGVTDVLLGGVAAVIAYFDFHNAKEGFDGILGAMILVVGVPVMLFVLIGDYIVSKIMENR